MNSRIAFYKRAWWQATQREEGMQHSNHALLLFYQRVAVKKHFSGRKECMVTVCPVWDSSFGLFSHFGSVT